MIELLIRNVLNREQREEASSPWAAIDLPSGPKLVKIAPGSKKAGFCGQIIPKTSQFKEDFGEIWDESWASTVVLQASDHC
jgi:hypothetical protein